MPRPRYPQQQIKRQGPIWLVQLQNSSFHFPDDAILMIIETVTEARQAARVRFHYKPITVFLENISRAS
jgi:hypothetical protein